MGPLLTYEGLDLELVRSYSSLSATSPLSHSRAEMDVL